MKRDGVILRVVTAEVTLPFGQLEFKLIVAGHFTCNTLSHSVHHRKANTCSRMSYIVWSVSE